MPSLLLPCPTTRHAGPTRFFRLARSSRPTPNRAERLPHPSHLVPTPAKRLAEASRYHPSRSTSPNRSQHSWPTDISPRPQPSRVRPHDESCHLRPSPSRATGRPTPRPSLPLLPEAPHGAFLAQIPRRILGIRKVKRKLVCIQQARSNLFITGGQDVEEEEERGEQK